MVERGPYVSYANCGLPYHIGDVIEKESSLLVATENTFRSQFAVDARTNCEAIKISPDKHRVGLSLKRVDSMAYADMDWQHLLEDEVFDEIESDETQVKGKTLPDKDDSEVKAD
jgi:NADPH-dependent 2,4-dienoyl-CoA reductase/sulfur reductase-like enzyme